MFCDPLAENITLCFVITGCSAVETYEYWLISSLYKRLTLSKSLKIKIESGHSLTPDPFHPRPCPPCSLGSSNVAFSKHYFCLLKDLLIWSSLYTKASAYNLHLYFFSSRISQLILPFSGESSQWGHHPIVYSSLAAGTSPFKHLLCLYLYLSLLSKW